jgi:prevent-host-death family protein
MNTGIQISEARKQLGDLVNEAYYTGRAVQLTKGDKPMAILVGTKEFLRMLKTIEAHDPGLADTMAIMSNPEVQEILEAGEENMKNGELISLEDAMKE